MLTRLIESRGGCFDMRKLTMHDEAVRSLQIAQLNACVLEII